MNVPVTPEGGLTFADGVDDYFARQLVNERLQEVRGRLHAQEELARVYQAAALDGLDG